MSGKFRWVRVADPAECHAPMARWGIHAVKLQELHERMDYSEDTPRLVGRWLDVPVFDAQSTTHEVCRYCPDPTGCIRKGKCDPDGGLSI